jgi:hypothetical protein
MRTRLVGLVGAMLLSGCGGFTQLRPHLAVKYADVPLRIVYIEDDAARDRACRSYSSSRPRTDAGRFLTPSDKILGCFVVDLGAELVIVTSPTRPEVTAHELDHLLDYVGANLEQFAPEGNR